MRIAAVSAIVIGYDDPNDFSTRRMTTLVRVETTDGIVGWGEGIAMWPEACKATKLLIEEGFAPLLRDAGDITISEAWDKMRAHAWWYGEGGIACFAYSALDMALWDIEGKIAGKPLVELFGRQRESLPAYAANHVNKATRAENVAEVVRFRDEGFKGVKLGFAKKGLSDIGRNPATDIAFIRDLRAAVGPDFEIIVDAGNGVVWDRETAIATVNAMAKYDIGWIEEPFYPSRIEDHRALKAATGVPIGTGEREWTVTGYQRLIETGTVDVVGIDPARAEGVTGFRKVDTLCTAHGLTINAHAWSTAILSAASLHLSLASPNTRLFELKPFPNPATRDLIDHPIWHEGGSVRAPTAPGLGITVDEAVARRLTLA
ncbi:mandelate racemase/muconate lactonizing enzyme family protein [Arsenicitalea aurantiaca]|uniref:Mandelate racemase/muconate lactonizing enzyme family protein n=1 Tax=Arsenicitalea aurantiaca TaxID=1783274 RepID=A0A433XLB2_9HYPH|nr:mandelate racemase/muconate lactonizing enzyme family protein [Arsenicitalea aurantiaca]RUT34872.1 mandelate racemase/muconate lactonizing enzyme family protein [Arsenicitalea aurantiaca]